MKKLLVGIIFLGSFWALADQMRLEKCTVDVNVNDEGIVMFEHIPPSSPNLNNVYKAKFMKDSTQVGPKNDVAVVINNLNKTITIKLYYTDRKPKGETRGDRRFLVDQLSIVEQDDESISYKSYYTQSEISVPMNAVCTFSLSE